MKDELLKKLGQLQYEISLLEHSEDELTGVTNRTDELKELIIQGQKPPMTDVVKSLLCVYTNDGWNTTEGKIYELKTETQEEFVIVNDIGEESAFYKRHFKKLLAHTIIT